MNNNKIYKSHSSGETEKIAEDFSKRLKAGDIVFLRGNLGSGKTTFVKGLAKGLGVKGRIISPTFVIVREHSIEKVTNGIEKLYHLDLYRLSSPEEVKNVLLQDILDDKKSITAIEWPDIGQEIVKEHYWSVNFTNQDENERVIEVNYEKQ